MALRIRFFLLVLLAILTAGCNRENAPGPKDLTLKHSGKVKREEKMAGMVVYPRPFAQPPRLGLEHATAGAFEIVAQDEFGFSWIAKELRKTEFHQLEHDVKDGKRSEFKKAWEVAFFDPSFTWTAVGMPGVPGKSRPRFLEQSGKFNSVIGEQGEVIFPLAYPAAPNVELSGSSMTIVVESRPTGFKWKNTGKDAAENKLITWKSKGLPKE